jgi:uncharacterized metal-binding protein
MRFESHLTFATVTALASPFIAHKLGLYLSLNDLIQLIPSIILGGAISCDIDTNSKASRYYGIFGILTTLYCFYAGNYFHPLIIWIPFILAKTGKHRGFTHSWFLPAIIVLLPPAIIKLIMFKTDFDMVWVQHLIINYEVAITGYAIGMYTHLIADIKVIKKIAGSIGGEKLVKKLYG